MDSSIIYLLFLIPFFSIEIYVVKCQTMYTEKKFDSILQNYLQPMRKISDFFPNRAVELQVEMDGKQARIFAPKKRIPTKAAYVPLQKLPPFLMTRANDNSDAPPTFTTMTTREIIQATEQVTPGTTTHVPLYARADSEEKLISWRDLKAIMGEIDNGIKIGSSENGPVKKRDLWMALGMKYGLKCNDNNNHHKLRNNEPKTEVTDSSLQKILDILKEGKIVDRNFKNPNGEDDLHWFKVRVPKNVL